MADRGEENDTMYGIVSPVRRVSANKESSVEGLGMREGVGRRVVEGAERRAAHQGRARKWDRSWFEGAAEGGMVAVLVAVAVEGGGDGWD